MKSGIAVTFIEYMENYIKDHHMTREKLVNEVGISQSSYQNIVKAKSTTNISAHTVKMLCDYFHCSADFVLGRINSPTHEKTDIHEVTGLSDQAIDTLKDIHQMHDKNNGSEPDHLPIINQLLASRKEAMDLLHWLEILIYLDADLAIHKKGKNIYPDKNEPHGFRLIHKDNPNAYTAIDVKDLIRANTYDKIKNTLADFINKYQK